MAELEIHVKRSVFSPDGKFLGVVEMKIWKVPKDKCHPEGYKYSLVFALYNETTGKFDGNFLRYDNYQCEGHHKHLKGKKFPYKFTDIEQLIEDFKNDFEKLIEEVVK
ncbi:toxin-antitoxin system TumE family protein [Aquifex aeolicus]|uniref:toxin-antitoxin system TumE family protein n=1 Tax=Aquifex aeolicus TaxID=63363 RepID=UPI0002DE07BC|nr:DUF6516 family protein [Aquifex aeolicus]